MYHRCFHSRSLNRDSTVVGGCHCCNCTLTLDGDAGLVVPWRIWHKKMIRDRRIERALAALTRRGESRFGFLIYNDRVYDEGKSVQR